jgi:hypothetical protein
MRMNWMKFGSGVRIVELLGLFLPISSEWWTSELRLKCMNWWIVLYMHWIDWSFCSWRFSCTIVISWIKGLNCNLFSFCCLVWSWTVQWIAEQGRRLNWTA